MEGVSSVGTSEQSAVLYATAFSGDTVDLCSVGFISTRHMQAVYPEAGVGMTLHTVAAIM